MDEIQLIKGCKENNPHAQKRLYDAYARKMMAVCLRYANDRESAQDLLQDGFIKVFTAIGSYSGSGSFEGWMRRIFVNTALESLRKNDILRETVGMDHPDTLKEADYSAIEKISADELMELVRELPPGFRAVFNMFAIEGYSHREIGEALGINESTSRSQYTRAKKLLQKKLNNL
ncbi:MAG: sigma-70 family RNA polymerase sigma factor [Coprobacter sp.]|nr:sigma-70 family RNA polymerase sigma factor [Coprobacter sp.]